MDQEKALGPIRAILILFENGKICKYVPIYHNQWHYIQKNGLERHLVVKNLLLNQNADAASLRIAFEHENGINWRVERTIIEIQVDEGIKQLRADYGTIERSADWWAARYIKNEEIKKGLCKTRPASQEEIDAFNKWASDKRTELNELNAEAKSELKPEINKYLKQ